MILKTAAYKLRNLVNEYLSMKMAQDVSTTMALKGDKTVPDEFYIKQIQKFITELPWDDLEHIKPIVSMTGIMDANILNALEDLNKIAVEIKAQSAVDAITKIKAGQLRDGASELFDAKSEIIKLIKSEVADDQWTFSSKKEYINNTQYPAYFPKPWQAKNVGTNIVTKDKCGPDDEDNKFRACQTPYFNHFLMWGPDCPGCGISGSDPRSLRLKSKYPEAFSYERNKERMDKHMWHPVVPSPGFSPFVAPPPQGTPFYTDPNNPRTDEEGVRFFDAEDETLYYTYLEAYKQFQQEFGSNASEYNEKFFAKLPHKRVRARGKPPNEWSTSFYGRSEPLWPDGTERPSAEELKKVINERGLAATSSLHNLSEKFKKIY